MPESCVLIIVGIFIGLMVYSAEEYDHRNHTDNRIVYFPSFTADLFFNVLLPPIILGELKLEVLRFRPWIRLRSRISTLFRFQVIPIPDPDPGFEDPDPPLDPNPPLYLVFNGLI